MLFMNCSPTELERIVIKYFHVLLHQRGTEKERRIKGRERERAIEKERERKKERETIFGNNKLHSLILGM